METILRNNRGIGLIVVIMISVVLLTITGAALLFSGLHLKASRNFKTRSEVFHIAEAGMNHAWQELVNNDGTNDFWTVFNAAGITTLLSNTTFGSGSYTVTGVGVSGSNPKQVIVTSTGCLPAGNPCPLGNARGVIQARFKSKLNFPYAVVTKTKMTLSETQADSFDSRVALYNGATAGSQAHMRSSTNDVVASGSALIKGNATAGETVSDPSKFTGTSTNGAAPITIPSVNSPCGASFSNGTGITGGTYNSSSGQLSASGGAVILANGTYCFRSVTLNGGAALTVAGPVTIYLTADSNFSGGSVVNTTSVASNLTICSTVASTSNGITFSGGSQAYLQIYAPDAKVTFSGGSEMYGAVVSGTFASSDGGAIHYDEALGGGGSGFESATLFAWKEVLS